MTLLKKLLGVVLCLPASCIMGFWLKSNGVCDLYVIFGVGVFGAMFYIGQKLIIGDNE